MLEIFKKEKLVIKFESVEEQKEFLEIAEKEGLKWYEGEKATDFVPNIHKVISCIYLNCYELATDEELYYLENGRKIITWKDYKVLYESSKEMINDDIAIELLKTNIFNLKMELWKERNKFDYISIINDEDFSTTHQLFFVYNFCKRSLIDLIKEYTYERINNWLVNELICEVYR